MHKLGADTNHRSTYYMIVDVKFKNKQNSFVAKEIR